MQMIRSLFFGGLAMFAAGCTTTTVPVPGEPTQIESVQSAAKAACAFLPTAETVADIIASGDPRLTSAAAVARAICAALVPLPNGIRTLVAPVPTVNGVVIRGEQLAPEGGT